MAGRNISPEFDEEELTPVAAEGHNKSIDENTIFSTPDPVAASTVGRTGKKMDSRYLQGSGVQGSFIDDTSAVFTPESTGEMNVLRMSLGSLELIPGDPAVPARDRNQSPSGFPTQPQGEASRSSLGIIQLENMDDLSSSLLHFDPASPQKGARQKSTVIDSISEDTEPETPKMAQLSSADSSHQQSHPIGGEEGESDAAESDMECLLRSQASQPVRNLFSTAGTSSSQEIAAAFAQLEGGGQMDTSLHEVHIDDEELMNFDEEFSDMSDLETTVTGSDELAVKGNDDQPEDDRHAAFGSVFEHDSAPPDQHNLDDMYRTMASYDEIDMPMEGSVLVENGPDSSFQFSINNRRSGGEGVESEENDTKNFNSVDIC